MRYQYNTEKYPDKHFPESNQVGFIAQELEQVAPELVTTQVGGLYGEPGK